MEYIREQNDVPVLGEYDVIVAGGGPSGVGAALAAARHGARTLLLERFSCLGGMWTSGLVNPLFDYENKGGIVLEIVEEINKAKLNSQSGGMYTFDMEYMKLLLDRLTRAAGVDLLFHTLVVKPLLDGRAVTGLIVENKSGRGAYLTKRVIDCTGDGDVAAHAGAPFSVGRPGDHAVQPMTLMFKIADMDYVQDYDYPYGNNNELFDKLKRQVARDGEPDYDFNFERPCLLRLPGAHTGVMQMTHMRAFDPLDAKSISEAEIEGRERVWDAMALLKRLPEFASGRVDQTATMIGVRESRRIKGEYELTLDDMLAGATFDDGFATCRFNVDIHQSDSKSQEDAGKYRIKPYQIPYRCLVPLAAENLLTAGRCVSGSFEAHASYRVTGDCVAMGQAAGTAAAMSIRMGVSPRALDGSLVVKAMERDGARVR